MSISAGPFRAARFQRGRAMKRVLLDRLPAYLHTHYPDRPALDREAVLEWVAANARVRSTRTRRTTASPASQTVTPGVSISGDPIRATGSETLPNDAPVATRMDAEAKLDRLLRSFLR
jgi:hypothetical protein